MVAMVISWRKTCIPFLYCTFPINLFLCQIVLEILTIFSPWVTHRGLTPLKVSALLDKTWYFRCATSFASKNLAFCDRICYVKIFLSWPFFSLVSCFDIFVSFLIFLPVVGGDGDGLADTRAVAPGRPPYVWLRTKTKPPLMLLPGQHTPEVSENKDDWRNHRFQLSSHHTVIITGHQNVHITILHQYQIDTICCMINKLYEMFRPLKT